jgi:hypothetical protein
MRRATDTTYPQNTSQIAMYAATRKFKFFIDYLPMCLQKNPASEEAGYSSA